MPAYTVPDPGYAFAQPLSHRVSSYDPAQWKPEPELAAPPPRAMASRWTVKTGLPVALVLAVSLYFLLKPLLWRAYILDRGIAAQALVMAKYRQTSQGLHGSQLHDFLRIRFETPAGWVTGRIGVTPSYYAKITKWQWLRVRYLPSSPPRVAFEGEHWYQFPPAWGLAALAFGLLVGLLGYARRRNLLQDGIPLPGLVTSVCEDTVWRTLQIYFERDGVPYSLDPACKMRASRPYKIGDWITLLVDPQAAAAPDRSQRVLVYPLTKLRLRRA
jgi:hypothetical protein